MITSHTLPLSAVLTSGWFEPAKVQREFQWRTVHVERLLNDLVAAFQRMGLDVVEADEASGAADQASVMEADGSDHAQADESPIKIKRVKEPARQAPDVYCLGSLIFFNTEPSEKFVVYDGLQRLTSLTILLCVMRDTWIGMAPADRDKLAELLFSDGAGRERRLDFPTSGRSLASLVKREALQDRELTDGDFRMREAIAFFTAQFGASWSGDRRSAFLDFLLNRVQLTVTRTDNHSVAYQMFVGANTRGLRLEVGDALKGLLADQVRSRGGTVAQVDACARTWRDARQTLRNGFDDFIHAVEVVKFSAQDGPAGKGPRHKSHTTGEKLQAFFGEADDPGALCDWVSEEFTSMARVFARSREHFRLREAEGVDIAFRQLSFLGWTEWQPLYLAIGLKYPRLASKAFVDAVRGLTRASYIIELLGWSEWTRRRKFLAAIEELDSLNPFRRNGALYFHPGGPACQEVKRKLRVPLVSEDKRGAIVRWIESLHWGGTVPRGCTDDASVEHVLPKAAMGSWHQSFDAQEREQCTHLVGNLCILDKEVNFKIGNKGWDEKLPQYESWRAKFKGVDLVLRTSSETASQGNVGHPWCARAVMSLTEVLATKAGEALSLG